VGVTWHLNVGAPDTGADGAPTPASWAGEGPDEVVRLELPPEQGPRAVRPKKMARRCAGGLIPPETVTRTAAPSPPRRRLRGLISRRLHSPISSTDKRGRSHKPLTQVFDD
jgi:hypothetical protein